MSSSLKQVAYHHLRRRLLSGAIEPGQRISPDASARELGMSQTPVREAIGLLEREGLVLQLPNLGAFARRLDKRELAELYDVRVLLEGFAAARAARRIKAADLRELESLFQKMRDLARRMVDAGPNSYHSPLGRQFALVDAAFHLVLLRAAGNRTILKIVDDLHVLSRLMSVDPQPVLPDVTAEMALQIKLHGRLLQAIRRRDPKAARRCMVHQHLVTKKILLERYERRGGDNQAEPGLNWIESVQRGIQQEEHSAASATVRAGARRRRVSPRGR